MVPSAFTVHPHSTPRISPTTLAKGAFLAKDTGILAGVALAALVFNTVDPSIAMTWHKHDGQPITKGDLFAEVRGPAASLLVAERIVLNFMQRMSGIATATSAMVKEVEGSGAKILETRKTVPGLRLPDKWAVLIGGGCNHRMGLFDMMMIKDNHIAAAGGIKEAVSLARKYLKENELNIGVEVEARTLEEVKEALELI